MADILYNLYLDESFHSRSDVYNFLSEVVCQNSPLSKESILQGFLDREAIGNIEIAEEVILPHFEASQLTNQIIILRVKEAIKNWSSQIQSVRLIIAILAEENSPSEEKKKIVIFVHKLASDDFINQLLEADKKNIFKIIEV